MASFRTPELLEAALPQKTELPESYEIAVDGLSSMQAPVQAATHALTVGVGAKRRAPPPQASEGGDAEDASSRETPMQRAARERLEMANEAERLRALRTPKEERKGFGFGFSLGGPQACETSYDCERPMVCCDLIFTSVCCNAGMMVGMPKQPSVQGALIPIPVERDNNDPTQPRGRGGDPGYGGQDGLSGW